MKLENLPTIRDLTVKHTNYSMALKILEEKTKALKNNRETIDFVLQNLNFVDDTSEVEAHINFLRDRIISNIKKTIDDIEKEIKKLD